MNVYVFKRCISQTTVNDTDFKDYFWRNGFVSHVSTGRCLYFSKNITVPASKFSDLLTPGPNFLFILKPSRVVK